MEDEHTIWYECRLCHILLPKKSLIKTHLSETHSTELFLSPSHLHQVFQDNPCSDYPEVEVLPGLERIKTESDKLTSTDDHGTKSKSSMLKLNPHLEDTDFSKTIQSLRSFWTEIEVSNAIVPLQECFKIINPHQPDSTAAPSRSINLSYSNGVVNDKSHPLYGVRVDSPPKKFIAHKAGRPARKHVTSSKRGRKTRATAEFVEESKKIQQARVLTGIAKPRAKRGSRYTNTISSRQTRSHQNS